MDSPRRQRSISLCQPHSTSPHPSRVGVPTWLPDALGCRPSTAGGQGATLSTFPLVPLTREPTCTQAIDPGISRSTLTPADTSQHFPDFLRSGSPWLAHGSPLHGNWFPNPMGLLLGAFGLPAHPMSHSPLPHPGTGPFPASHGLPTPSGRCAALATRPSPPRPLVPSSRVYTPPGPQQPCGAGPLDPHPSGDRFVRLARVAPFPPLSPVPRPRPNTLGCCVAPSHPSSPVYTPPGRQQRCGAGPLDPHPSGDRFVRLARVAPLPPPPLHSCAASHAVPVPWGRRVALATRPFLSRLLVVLRGAVRVFFFRRAFFRVVPSSLHARTTTLHRNLSRFRSVLSSSPTAILWRGPWRSPVMPGERPSLATQPFSPRCCTCIFFLSSPPSPPLCLLPALLVLFSCSARHGCISRALTGLWASALSSDL